jgi:hypothetical protein
VPRDAAAVNGRNPGAAAQLPRFHAAHRGDRSPGPEAERIEKILATLEGKALYRRMQQIVEPVFTNTKFIRGADRFQRRGLAACREAPRRQPQPPEALCGIGPAGARLTEGCRPSVAAWAVAEGDCSNPIN